MWTGRGRWRPIHQTRFSLSNFSVAIRERIPAEYLPILEAAATLGGETGQSVGVVGGGVRDLLLDRTIREVDVVIEPPVRAIAEELARRYNGKLISHDAFHTFTISLPSGSKLDLVTAREETYRASGALPDVTPSTLEKDLKRRDFTINAMALLLNRQRFGELLDPHQGQADLKLGLIRILHPMSFVDDPTRLFRAVRFAARFKFSLEAETEILALKAVRSHLPHALSPGPAPPRI
jgi:tRNA nucleotidyltransferase (CCA-adding enzyme)